MTIFFLLKGSELGKKWLGVVPGQLFYRCAEISPLLEIDYVGSLIRILRSEMERKELAESR